MFTIYGKNIIPNHAHEEEQVNISKLPEISIQDLERYKTVLQQTSTLSESMVKNFNAVSVILQKINESQSITSEKIDKLNQLTQSISNAAKSLSDEKAISGLKSLEAIVKK